MTRKERAWILFVEMLKASMKRTAFTPDFRVIAQRAWNAASDFEEVVR